MSRARQLDGIDFRPFFDMVVGILFVLLILIGALIFFQQAQDSSTASTEARIEEQRRRAELNDFLDRLAASLRDRGFPARSDLPNQTVVVPLSTIAAIAPQDALPELKAEAVGKIGAAVEAAVRCVSVPRAANNLCPGTELLHLDSLLIEVRMGRLGTALAQDRAARLTRNLLSGALLRRSLGLLDASNAAGDGVVAFGERLTSAEPAPDDPVPGDLALVFAF